MCLSRVNVNSKVLRWGKWNMSEEQYSVERYPNFCNGAGIAFTRPGKCLTFCQWTNFYHFVWNTPFKPPKLFLRRARRLGPWSSMMFSSAESWEGKQEQAYTTRNLSMKDICEPTGNFINLTWHHVQHLYSIFSSSFNKNEPLKLTQHFGGYLLPVSKLKLRL